MMPFHHRYHMPENKYIKAKQAGEEFVLDVTVTHFMYIQMQNAAGVISSSV